MVGSVASNFRGTANDGHEVQLKNSIGRAPVVLYFYPNNATVGCVDEICSLKDNFGALSRLKATIYGISGDSVQSHHKFARKYGLPFLLISDPNHRIARLYDADDPFGEKRTAIVID